MEIGLAAVSEDDLCDQSCRVLFSMAKQITREGGEANISTIAYALERIGKMTPQAQAFLDRIAEEAPTPGAIKVFARDVRDQALRRRIESATQRTLEAVKSGREGKAKDLLSRVVGIWQEVEGSRKSETFRTFRQALDGTYSLWREREQGGGVTFSTGISDLDAAIGGFQPKRLIVQAARPKRCKTTLAVFMLTHLAKEQGVPVLFHSMEMAYASVTEKVVATRSGVHPYSLRKAHFGEQNWGRLNAYRDEEGDIPFFIDEARALSTDDLCASIRRAVREYGVRVAAIDYLQLIPFSGDDPRHTYVAATHAFQALAGELSIVLLLLSQLSRKTETHPNRRPEMEDLKESGTIEEDADQVLLLYHPPDGQPRGGPMQILVAANRHGESRDVGVYWDAEFQRFRDLTSFEEVPLPQEDAPSARSRFRPRGGEDA